MFIHVHVIYSTVGNMIFKTINVDFSEKILTLELHSMLDT